MEEFASPLLNYGKDKLSMDALMKIFVAAHLGKWESYAEIEEKIRSDKAFRKSLNLPSISGSQLSRRINDLSTEWPLKLFSKVVKILGELTENHKGVTPEIGLLKVVDSTHFKLFPGLCDWAFVTKGWNVVKMHTRYSVTAEGTGYPDKIIPSTGNVSDFESADKLIEKSDATYLMDRGYPSLKNLATWLEQDILFVARITKNFKLVSQEDYEINHPAIIKDAKVFIHTSDKPVRLVEFKDEEGRLYRLMSTRWDLTGEQIMDSYRYRWMIETFFRWIKQHLGIVKIWSTKPQGIWNQMFMALTAYALALIIQLQTKTKKTLWEVLRSMRTYMFKTWGEFTEELFRRKSKTTKGRQKIPKPKDKEVIFEDSVAMIKPQKKKQ